MITPKLKLQIIEFVIVCTVLQTRAFTLHIFRFLQSSLLETSGTGFYCRLFFNRLHQIDPTIGYILKKASMIHLFWELEIR